MINETEIRAALTKVMDPEIGHNIIDLGMVRDLAIDDAGNISFTLALTVPTCPMKDHMAFNAQQVLRSIPGVNNVNVDFGLLNEEERRAVIGKAAPQPPKLNAFNRVQRVIAVMSGKGGVGKSSLTALLAVELARRGSKVGILDADITGASIPRMFGLPAGGLRGGPQGILPAATPLGIRIVSTNLLVAEEDTAVIWRGPMISATIQQFWNEVLWGKLDVLLVDMPPGTSDVAITVLKTLPVNGVLLVTSPQGLAALVVRKAVHMLSTLEIPILGLIENFSYFTSPESGIQHQIFGPSHAQEVASLVDVELLAQLPIDPQITALCDVGKVEQVQLPLLTPIIERLLMVKTVSG
jgi:ATP-binding protein involved in chromosome partitioning